MKDNKGQIGPNSLEDIVPMTLAFIAVFVLIAAVFTTIAGNLEQRSAESAQQIAVELPRMLAARSPISYDNTQGLLDASKLSSADYDGLKGNYSFTGYSYSVEIIDLKTGAKWSYEPPEKGTNTAGAQLPVAIRYSAGTVNEGLIRVKVWRR